MERATRALSPRLQQVLDYIEPCQCLCDIGSDHGYVICHAVARGVAKTGIAVEISQAPYEQTIRTVDSMGLSHRIDVLLGDGLSPIDDGRIDALCIAGMGGKNIAGILHAGASKLSSLRQLVLQANVDAGNVRDCLDLLGFAVQGETLVSDNGFIYQVISADPRSMGAPQRLRSRLEREYGEHNLVSRNPLMAELLQRDLAHLSLVMRQLGRSQRADSLARRIEVQAHMEELIACLAKLTDQ